MNRLRTGLALHTQIQRDISAKQLMDLATGFQEVDPCRDADSKT
jgi:hypothetical protein